MDAELIAIILAGGYATRLYPITKNISKPLLLVKGRPIIDYIVERLEEIKEIDRIIVATNEKFKDQFIEWLSKDPHKNIDVRVEHSWREEEKLGALRALADLIEEIESEEYLVIAGDNLFTSRLIDFYNYYKDKRCAIVAVYDVKDSEMAKRFSTAELGSDNVLKNFVEKPMRPNTTLIGTCIYLLPNISMRRIHEYLKQGHNPDSPGHFIEWLCKREKVCAYVLRGKWWDIGSLESYKEANRTMPLDR
ncbi:MAG: nucleotidyltransferase family protein [Thermoproteota archaeon]